MRTELEIDYIRIKERLVRAETKLWLIKAGFLMADRSDAVVVKAIEDYFLCEHGERNFNPCETPSSTNTPPRSPSG